MLRLITLVRKNFQKQENRMGYLGMIYIGYLLGMFIYVLTSSKSSNKEAGQFGLQIGLLASSVITTLGILKILQLLGVGL